MQRNLIGKGERTQLSETLFLEVSNTQIPQKVVKYHNTVFFFFSLLSLNKIDLSLKRAFVAASYVWLDRTLVCFHFTSQ